MEPISTRFILRYWPWNVGALQIMFISSGVLLIFDLSINDRCIQERLQSSLRVEDCQWRASDKTFFGMKR